MNRRTRGILVSLMRYVAVIFSALVAIFPIYWMFSTSIKLPNEWVATPSVWFPSRPVLINYQFIFSQAYEYTIGRRPEEATAFYSFAWSSMKPVFDSLILSTFGTLIALFAGTLSAYVLSRYGQKGAPPPVFPLMYRMFPPVAIIVPVVIMYAVLHLIDTYAGIIILYATMTVPLVLWLMKSFFDEIPREIDEAAILDGCSLFKAFYKGVLPLAKAGLAVTGLFIFILDWSDFMGVLLLGGRNVVTIPLKLAEYTSGHGELYGPMAAMGMVAVIPPLILGILIQKYLVRGFTFGAIKG
jgi:multiple sugar transport system permease protein